jgi:hypothetical protein
MTFQRVADISIARQMFELIAKGEKTDKVQLHFDASVLAKYRADGNYKIIRTNTSGRVSKVGAWSVDFGISGDDDALIHIPVEALVNRIPSGEKEHWLASMVTLAVSANFIKGLIRPGCLDDGDIRAWE